MIFSTISFDWIPSNEFQTQLYMSIESNLICFQKQWDLTGRICSFRQQLYFSNILWIWKWPKRLYFFIFLPLSNSWFIFFSSVCHQRHRWSVAAHLPYRVSKYIILYYSCYLLTNEKNRKKEKNFIVCLSSGETYGMMSWWLEIFICMSIAYDWHPFTGGKIFRVVSFLDFSSARDCIKAVRWRIALAAQKLITGVRLLFNRPITATEIRR